MSLQDQLGERYSAARNAARGGHYQLLLGAGASRGARSAAGAVPDGKELVSRLAKQYPNARISEGSRLERAYQRAVIDAGSDDVWRFLRRLFHETDHEAWFTELAALPWRRVWTLNVDDAFERAYSRSDRQEHAALRVIDWIDDYIEPLGPEIIHLHGRVAGPEPSPLVFSLSEYHASIAAHGVWQKVLRGVLASEPVVIVGARVLDDIDVETLVLSASPHAHAPSLIVDPYISEDNEWELSRAGFIVLKTSAADFVYDWIDTFGLGREDRRIIYEGAAVNMPQITELRIEQVTPAPAAHDFFGGSEPRWSDACHGYIAPFEWIDSIATHVRDWSTSDADSVFVRMAYVPRLAGGTAGLLAVAHAARRAGVRVLRFDRSVRFSPQRVLDMCRGSGPVLFLIDGGFAYADDVHQLASLAKQVGDTKLYVLLIDRPQRHSLIEDHLTGATYAVEAQHVRLRRTSADARTIVRVLMTHGRVEQLKSMSAQERTRLFYNRDIFSAMSEVENAAGFRVRLDAEIGSLTTGWHRDLVLLLALAAQGGAQVSLTEAGFALDVPVQTILDAVDDSEHLGALVEIDDDLLYSRHRVHALGSLIAAGGQPFVQSLTLMLQRLAALLPRDDFGARTRGWSLVRHLMSAKLLHDLFPRVDMDTLYSGIRAQYGDWNARFWEQRSIYARITGNLDPAVSYAEQAVSVHDDSFTRNTLAVNLLSKASDGASRDDPTWRQYYQKGWSEFDLAAQRDRSGGVAQWARLTSGLDLIEALADRARKMTLREPVEDVLDEWSTAYGAYRISLPNIRGSEAVSEAEGLSRRFTRLQAELDSPRLVDVHDTSNDVATGIVDEVVKTHYQQLRRPVPVAYFAKIVREALPAGIRSDWGGYGKFGAALRAAVPDARITPERAGTLHPAGANAHAQRSAAAPEPVASAALAEAIRRAVAEIDRPTPLAAIAARVRHELKLTGIHDWAGHTKFKDALRDALPGVDIDPTAPGFVLPDIREP